MSVVDEILEAIGTAAEQVTEAQGSITSAGSRLEEALTQAQAFGVESTITAMQEAKEKLDAAIEQIAATASGVEEAQTAVQSLADGT